MRIGLFIKGNSKKTSVAKELLFQLEAHNFHVTTAISESADSNEKIRKIIESNCELMIIAGGDGTLHECINMIMLLNSNSTLKIAHFPIGTANDFAKTIKQTIDINDFIQLIKAGKFTAIDIGQITTVSNELPTYFINIADAGIGGEIIHSVNRGNKKLGKLIYTIELVKGLITFKRKNVIIKYDDNEQYTGKLLSLVVANGNYFANGLHIAPHASINSGKFAITQFGDVTVFDYFRNIRKIKKGLYLDHPEVKYLEASKIEIESSEKTYHLEADGEYVGHTKARITIIKDAIECLIYQQ